MNSKKLTMTIYLKGEMNEAEKGFYFQAKEEAQAEIEKYKSEREKQFGEHEAKFAGAKDDIGSYGSIIIKLLIS